MGLKVFPAPWSPVARDERKAGDDSLRGLAESEAQKRLAKEILRYARGEVAGRSFLVAGHRGAGKTTAVLAAMQQVYNECLDGKGAGRRPLLIRLHGPSLLIEVHKEVAKQAAATTVPEKPTASATTTEAAPETDTTEQPKSPAVPKAAPAGEAKPPANANTEPPAELGGLEFSERFLREMAAGIFPALIDEVRRRMTVLASGHLEMIAHTCDELTQGMTLAELREMFRRMGLLPGGLLGSADVFQELVALNAAAEAYLVVTGKLDTNSSLDNKAVLQAEQKAGADLAGDKVVKALTPVAVGAAAALGITVWNPAAAAAVAIGILVSGLAYTTSTSRSLSRAAARTRSFKRDNTHDSLVRRVPLLVEQLRQVGFPPVFVLDEMDKLPNDLASTLLDWLLRNLKSYVTERSFICFVVERSYYEGIASQRVDADGRRYPASYTFYSDLAYVIPKARDFHKYMRAVLDEDAPLSATAPDDEAARHRVKQRQLATLRHGLLNRARMHPYDLRRQLQQAEERGELTRMDERVGLPVAWVYRALLQLTIEWVMSEALLRMASADDPYLAQLQLDCMYGVSEAWELGKPLPPHDQSNEALAAAREHLLGCLRQPRLLLEQVRDELDLERLESFFSGEQDGDARDLDNAAPELAKLSRDPSDRERMRRYFATRKYAVLLDATADGVRPMLDASGQWLVSSFGYSSGLASLDLEIDKRVQALLQFRAHYREQGLSDTEFALLWNVNGAYPFEQLDIAIANREKRPADRELQATIGRYAPAIPTACQLLNVLVVGVAVLRSIRPVELADAVRLLRLGIQGSTVRDRAVSCATLVESLAKGHDIELPSSESEFLSATRAGKAVAWKGTWQLKLPAPRADIETVRNGWFDSLAQRLLASVVSGPSEPPFDEQARRLDIASLLNEWCPVVLGGVWPRWERPQDWTIVVYSELLAEVPERAPRWLRAFAAAKLGLTVELKNVLGETDARPATTIVQQVVAWEESVLAQETKLGKSLPRVIIVNPGVVTSKWRAPQGFCVLSLRDDPSAEDFGKRFAPLSDLLISETVVEAPKELGVTRFFAVETGSASTTQPGWRRLPKDTVVVLAPTSLEAAVATFMRAVDPASAAP